MRRRCVQECGLGVQTRFRILLSSQPPPPPPTTAEASSIAEGGGGVPFEGLRALGRRAPRSGVLPEGCGGGQEVRVCNRHACNQGRWTYSLEVLMSCSSSVHAACCLYIL